jgi:hypothetical protein
VLQRHFGLDFTVHGSELAGDMPLAGIRSSSFQGDGKGIRSGHAVFVRIDRVWVKQV